MANTITDGRINQQRATVTTLTRGKPVVESTLETAPGMETQMVIQAGIQFDQGRSPPVTVLITTFYHHTSSASVIHSIK